MVHFKTGCHSPTIPGWIECKSQLCTRKWSKTGSNGLADIPWIRHNLVMALRIDILHLWPNKMKRDDVKQWDVANVKNSFTCGINYSKGTFLKSPKILWITSRSMPSPRETVQPISFSLKKWHQQRTLLNILHSMYMTNDWFGWRISVKSPRSVASPRRHLNSSARVAIDRPVRCSPLPRSSPARLLVGGMIVVPNNALEMRPKHCPISLVEAKRVTQTIHQGEEGQ